MKNACIAVRCKTSPPDGEISRVLAALIEGGYCADKIFVLASGEMHEFAQTVIECKNFFDNVFVCAHADELSALRGKVQELLGGTLTAGNKRFFCIPDGEEGERAVRGEVIPALRESDPSPLSRSFVRAVGVPAGLLSSALEEARARAEGITFSCHEKDGDVRIEMRYPADIAKSAADEGMRVLAGRLADYVYAIDDTPLNRRVYELLKLRGLKLSVAESFTGGGVAKKIIEIPGASEVLFESVVAYDNGSKMKRLGVSAKTLAEQGAVSDETAYEMAAGLLSTGGCTAVLSTTGIAGPASDDTHKPVGLCYIAAGGKEAVYVYKYLFRGSRGQITARAVNQALFLLYKQIK